MFSLLFFIIQFLFELFNPSLEFVEFIHGSIKNLTELLIFLSQSGQFGRL
jgi:hypothetical protein